MGRETAAFSAITRHLEGGGYQTVFACPAHVMQTIRQLGGQDLEVAPANPEPPANHRCKGCDAGWAPGALAG